jgi:hypothetical protein
MKTTMLQDAPPAPPALPAQARPTAVDVGTDAPIPLTGVPSRADVQALEARRSELSRQITSANKRREDVVRDLRRADDLTRPGLQDRLKVLDGRIVQLEEQIAENGRMLAEAPRELAVREAAEPPARYGPFTSGQLTAVSIVGTLGVLMPLAFGVARAMLVRARQPRITPELLEATRRMERMEQAIDAVAVEVERISEGQRYVTQLMAAKQKEEAKLIGGA